MKTALGSLIDRKIGVFLDHNLFAEGVLLDIKQDHLAVHIEGKICYFTLAHIHAFTGNTNDEQTSLKEVVYLNSNDLIGVLTNLLDKWVMVNRFSNQVFSGVLSSIQDDYIVVTNDQELHCIAISCIATIDQGVITDESKLTITKMTERPSEINKEIPIEDSFLRLVSVIKQLIVNSEKDVQTSLRKEQPRIRKDEKRILLTPWSEMNYDQNTIAIPATNKKKNPSLVRIPLEKNEIILDKKLPITKTKRMDEQTAGLVINPKEKKAMLEKQYYALMRHAEQNHDQVTEEPKKIRAQKRKKDEKVVVEKQYYSLMKHAAKMYRQLRD